MYDHLASKRHFFITATFMISENDKLDLLHILLGGAVY